MHKKFLSIIGTVGLLALGGCANADVTDGDDAEEMSAENIRSEEALTTYLENEGFEVTNVSIIHQPFFTPDGTQLSVDDEMLQVYAYDNEEDLTEESAKISPDGSSVNGTMISWIDDPHFFKRDTLLVVYTGRDEDILETLEEIFGPQFAGQQSVTEPGNGGMSSPGTMTP